jgi:gliding motility-associated-like protein
MMMRNKLRIGILVFIASLNYVFSQTLNLAINEYSAANINRSEAKFRDRDFDTPDWIEIFNADTVNPVTINGFYLSDNESNKKRYRIPLEKAPKIPKINIPPGGYKVIFCSGKDTVYDIGTLNQIHTNFKLTQTKAVAEQIFFSDKNGNPIDNVTIKRNQPNHSWGRYFYGPIALSPGVKNRKFYVYVRPTPGSFNDSNKVGVVPPKKILAYIDYLKSPEMKTQPGYKANGVLIDFKPIYITTGTQPQQALMYSLSNQIPSYKAGGAVQPDTFPIVRTATLVSQTATSGPYTGTFFDAGVPPADSVFHTFTIKARYCPQDSSLFYYLPSFPITNTYFIKGVADSIKVGSNKLNLVRDSAQKLPIIHISDNKYSISTIPVDPPSNTLTPVFTSTNPLNNTFKLPAIFGLFSSKLGDSTYATLEYFEPGGKRSGVYNGYVFRKAKRKRTANFEQRNISFKPDDERGIAPLASVDGQKGITYQLKHKFFNNPALSPSEKDEFKKIHLRPAGNDNFFSISDSVKGVPGTLRRDTVRQTQLRDGMVETYAAKIGLNFETRNYQPCLLFVNGRYNGIYDIRETFNNNFTKANFKQGKKDVDIIKYDVVKNFAINPTYNHEKRVREGSGKDWYALCKFILNNKMTDTNFEYVKSKMSITSLIDYVIYNQYTGNSHFLNDNVGIWRGRNPEGVKQKWRFFAYDMDNVYERSVGFSFKGNIQNTTPYIFTPCSYAEKIVSDPDTAGIYDVFKRLYDSNFVFKSQYLFRFNELLDGPLKCDSMIAHFDKVKALTITQIRRHVANNTKNRYNYAGGQQAAFLKITRAYDSLREYITRRCTSLDSTLRGCDSLVKPKQNIYVKILPDSLPVGKVTVNNNEKYATKTNLTLTHVYMNTRLDFEAISTNPDYVFDRWTTTNKKDTIRDTLFSNSMYLKVTKADTICAVFRLVPKDQLDFPLQFPSAFSPNGDGRNDVFAPVGGGGDIVQYEMQIFNRWGELIYNTYDRNRGWNGKQYGADAPIGVYAFRITAVDINNKKINKVGNVTLLR